LSSPIGAVAASKETPMLTRAADQPLRLAIPKGRMQDGVISLLASAGIHLRCGPRDYRPTSSLPGVVAKILKPQSILEMLHHGSRDVGFAGADWASELGVEVVELLDTALDPVRLVAAAPAALLAGGRLPDRPLVVASEYERLSRTWIAERGMDARFVHSYGATEVFPPEDADCIIDNTATGSTLRANGLEIVDEVLRSSTRLYAHPAVLEDSARRAAVEQLITLLRSVLDARRRVMLEVNVSAQRLASVIEVLPCMREPTVSPLHGDSGYAVKAAVPRERLPQVITDLKLRGGTDVVVTSPAQIVP
jgi:ATP phosphoribosyltransferase